MSARCRWRPLVLLALAVAVVLGVAGPALAAPAVGPARQADDGPTADDAPSDDAPDPFDKLASCVGAEGRLLVVLLIDESASLRQTDPDDQRIAAARSALRSIDLLRSSDGASDVAIDLLVSTFSFDFVRVGEWTPLTDDSRDELDEMVAGLADRDASMDTDFHNALSGARQALADRATETGVEEGGSACKAVLLFTDGAFTLGPRETLEQREQFGVTKVYAPDVELTDADAVDRVTRAGIDALCQPEGVADQVRADNITLVAVPLGEGSGLLEAITTGSAGATTCGDPATTTPGAYLPAADTQELVRTFDFVASRIAGGVLVADPVRPEVCADDECPEGAVTFTVSSSLARAHVFAAVPDDDTRVVLTPPGGDALEVVPDQDDGEAEVGSAPVTVATIAPRTVTVDLQVPADGSADGDWTVTLVGGEGTGSVQVLTFTDLVAVLRDSALVLGEEGTVRAVVLTRDGAEPEAELADATVRATLTDPIDGTSETVALEADGDAFSAPFTVPDDVTAAGYEVTLALDATTAEGAVIRSVSPEQTLVIGRPPGYPSIAPPTVVLTSVEGEGTAEGSLFVQPSEDGDGCVWFDEAVIVTAPEEAGEVVSRVDTIGASADECTPVEGPLEVVVTLDPEARASGTVSGRLRFQVAVGEGDEPLPTDVLVTFEMAKGIDQAKRLLLAVGLMVGGLVGPLVLLVVVNLLTTRFQSLDDVQAAWVPIVVNARRQVLRADGRVNLNLRPTDFAPLDVEEGSSRRFVWNGLVFRARTPVNPFGEPYASVAPEGGTADVAREGRRTDLALGLAGSWMVLLDQDATRASGGEVHGVLVAFAATDAVGPQARRLGTDVSERGARTALRLAELAGIPAPRPPG